MKIRILAAFAAALAFVSLLIFRADISARLHYLHFISINGKQINVAGVCYRVDFPWSVVSSERIAESKVYSVASVSDSRIRHAKILMASELVVNNANLIVPLFHDEKWKFFEDVVLPKDTPVRYWAVNESQNLLVLSNEISSMQELSVSINLCD